MSNQTITYISKFIDKFGRTIEYHVSDVPYEEKVEGEDEYIFSGRVLNKVIDLRNDLRTTAEIMDTSKKYWVIQINYNTGRFKIMSKNDAVRQ